MNSLDGPCCPHGHNLLNPVPCLRCNIAASARSQRYAEMELRYDGPMPESAKRYIETGEW